MTHDLSGFRVGTVYADTSARVALVRSPALR